MQNHLPPFTILKCLCNFLKKDNIQQKWIYAYNIIWTSVRPNWKENVEFEEKCLQCFCMRTVCIISWDIWLHKLSWKKYKKSEFKRRKVTDETKITTQEINWDWKIYSQTG